MPSKKNRPFSKKNSVKLLLLPGNKNAVNADGECLQNILLPVSHNYKTGSSILISKITKIVEETNDPGPSSGQDIDKQFDYDVEEGGNLKNIMGQFDDASDSENENCSKTKFKRMCQEIPNDDLCNRLNLGDLTIKEEYEEDSDCFGDYSDDSDFSDEHLIESSEVRKNCPESLKILEGQMEKKLAEYDDDQIGALDGEEIYGPLDCEEVSAKYLNLPPPDEEEEEEFTLGNYDQTFKDQILKYAETEHKENIVEIVTEKPLEFDCESILSTYSNIYNHPTIIKEVVQKIKVPANPLKKQLTKSKLKQLETIEDDSDYDDEGDSDDDDNISIISTVNSRPKGETPEQRRERKQSFKEAKRESRILKKENKLAFKVEKKLQRKQLMSIQNNKGKRIV